MYSIKISTELIHQVAHTLMGCDRSLLLLLHQLKLRKKISLHHFIKHSELELSPKSTVKHLTATYCSEGVYKPPLSAFIAFRYSSCVATYVKRTSKAANHPAQPPRMTSSRPLSV